MLILINRFYKFSLLIASLFLSQFTFAQEEVIEEIVVTGSFIKTASKSCLLYTSDAADEP